MPARLAFGAPVELHLFGEPDPSETWTATTGDGVLVNSGPLDGLSKNNAIKRIIEPHVARVLVANTRKVRAIGSLASPIAAKKPSAARFISREQ